MGSKHDQLVNRLEKILFNERDYEYMLKFWEYCKNGYAGEVDLLAYADGIYDFFEVKSNCHQKAKKKAYEQFERFKLAFPERRVIGFMYCGKELIRL